ncbi:MAG TPA: zinc-dependent metalloprotease family protein [Rudaea sp.]|nr:zinc-dependent metalloprotease family protein [Rudaea sp.]
MRDVPCRRQRRRYLCAIVFASLSLAAANAFAGLSPWRNRSAQPANDTHMLDAPLHSYRALNLDVSALRAHLDSAPDPQRAATPLLLDLPMADGTTTTFTVWRTQVMAPALAAKFPEIRSFAGYAVDNPEIAVRMDDSPLGFSAMIRAPNGVTMVQPITLGNGTRYISFRRNALGKSSQPFVCGVHTQAIVTPTYPLEHAQAPPMAQTVSGATVRTYRLALAATGEYTAVFGGTIPDAMAAMVQAINRVNGIYLTDFAVQFQLVANDDSLIYTNAATDPYSNDDGAAMLSENQHNIDLVIGSANYDFGHVFSTGGGGIADLGVACTKRSKAQGVTGLPSPVGDAFWVDYVAHEMGHQMGADHSYNTQNGSCGDGNRAGSQAAEPGSGSTIMAYAGICGPSDLQPHSDAYFHAISLSPIVQRLAFGGSACGSTAIPTNGAPIVDAGPDFNIPAQTPFELIGNATDADGDTLTYAWEEMDKGTASPPESDDGTRALFRSFSTTTSSRRIIPELARVLSHNLDVDIPSGGDIPGETWATTTRDLKFRLTVRDNHPDGGATASDDMVVHVDAASGPFRVTAPLAAAAWVSGSSQDVTWNVANTTAAPVSCAGVDISYSTDGGQTFPTMLASNVPNSGTTTIAVPQGATTAARVKVTCNGNIFFDISPGDFTVTSVDLIFRDGFGGD